MELLVAPLVIFLDVPVSPPEGKRTDSSLLEIFPIKDLSLFYVKVLYPSSYKFCLFDNC
jgi:hypothetical protein